MKVITILVCFQIIFLGWNIGLTWKWVNSHWNCWEIKITKNNWSTLKILFPRPLVGSPKCRYICIISGGCCKEYSQTVIDSETQYYVYFQHWEKSMNKRPCFLMNASISPKLYCPTTWPMMAVLSKEIYVNVNSTHSLIFNFPTLILSVIMKIIH